MCTLLAAGVLGLIPHQSQDHSLPGFDFGYILAYQSTKAACLMHYFRQAMQQEEAWQSEVISFQRSVLPEDAPERFVDFWAESQETLRPVQIKSEGGIEDAHGMLQADFANEYIGGGVFFEGRVQEEIRFSISPELLVACLLCEAMAPHEAVVIVGAQQFTEYRGYGRSFEAVGPNVDPAALDSRGRRDVQVVAFDAMHCDGDLQYQTAGVMRELVKAATAFRGELVEEGRHKKPLATGNWGAGAFGGDPQLKFLLQWMACSVCGREMVFYSFHDDRMADISSAISLWSGKSVSDVWRALQRAHATQPRARDATKWKYRP